MLVSDDLQVAWHGGYPLNRSVVAKIQIAQVPLWFFAFHAPEQRNAPIGSHRRELYTSNYPHFIYELVERQIKARRHMSDVAFIAGVGQLRKRARCNR